MRIQLKSAEEIGYMREAGRILAACHREIAKHIKPGVSTLEIDGRVEDFLKKKGRLPNRRGIKDFLMPHVLRLTRWCVMGFRMTGRCGRETS